MNLRLLVVCSLAICADGPSLSAQDANEVEALKKQLQQVKEDFQKAMRKQQQVIESLQKRIDALQSNRPVTNTAPPAPAIPSVAQSQAASTAPSATLPPAPWSPSQPITIARAGSAYMNISFDALLDFGWSTDSEPARRLLLGDHDPNQRGFTLATSEFAMQGAVDPYFSGFANIVFKLDQHNETEVELEETYLTTTSLPANLQLKAGQMFVNFGRQNPQHPHQWAFVDSPLILTRTFGPEALQQLGAQVSWLAPTPHYIETFMTVLNGRGESAFSFRNRGEDDGAGTERFHGRATLDRHLRGAGDLVFVPRVTTSFDITDEQTLVLGASAAVGPNDTGPHTRTEIYGVDAYWKWKSAHSHAGFPFVSWQTEALYQRFEAGADPFAPTPLPAETLRDWGFYSQVLWGFHQRWVAGLRGEFVTGNEGAFDAEDIFRGDRTRVSPNLTWYPSEFSKIRLQYNYDHGEHFGDEHSAWLQVEFQLGAHAPHKF